MQTSPHAATAQLARCLGFWSVVGIGIGVSYGVGRGALQLRAEASTLVATGGGEDVGGHGHRLGAAVRWLALEKVISGYTERSSGFGLALDAGAGQMWWYDPLGGGGGAYGALGLALTTTMAGGATERSQFHALGIALVGRVNVMMDGWTVLGGAEVAWMD